MDRLAEWISGGGLGRMLQPGYDTIGVGPTIFLLLAGVALLCWMPGLIATSRKCAGAKVIRGVGLVSFVFPPLWLAAMIAAVASPKKASPRRIGARLYSE